MTDNKALNDPKQAVEDAARGAPGARRLLAFLSPDAPVDALARAQRASDWAERAAIAMHPKTPADVLKRLTEDGNSYVRALARESLASRET
jgi:hypothetical protein